MPSCRYLHLKLGVSVCQCLWCESFSVLWTQILVARPEDSGMYVCTARNSEGTSETKVEVIVDGGSQVPSVPRASVPEPLVIVVEGQTTTLHCETHGSRLASSAASPSTDILIPNVLL